MSLWLEDFLYPVEPLKPRTRTKPMQVLALGLSRMGTESLRRALQDLGYDHVYHGFDVMQGGTPIRKAWTILGRRKWGLVRGTSLVTGKDLDEIIGHCEAVTDQPCACFAPELLEAHPGAKVILNYRDVEPWYESIVNTFGVQYASWVFNYLCFFDTFLYWRTQSFMHYEYGFFQGSTLRNAKRVQKEHFSMIRDMVPSERLLEWKVQDGWAPLCEFLGKPVPEKEFPHGNTPTDLQTKAYAASSAAIQRAYVRLGFTILSVAIVLIAWWR